MTEGKLKIKTENSDKENKSIFDKDEIILEKKPSLLVDDISMFLAWQNWYLMQQCQSLQTAYYQNLHYQSQLIRQRNLNQATPNHPSNSSGVNSTNNPTTQPSPFTQPQRTTVNAVGTVHTLASYQARFIAEAIDFLILLIIKVVIVMLFLGENYIEQFQYVLIIDETTNMDDLEWVIIQAMIFRLIVIVYEALMCWSQFNRPLKGATIGKAVMGLKIVSCEAMVEMQGNGNIITIIPGQDIGITRSFSRALLKNVTMSFFFPLLFPVMIFKYNRLIYDTAVGTVVVHSSERRNQRN